MIGAPAALAQASPSQRDAAFRQLKRPGGVGGCVFAAVPAEMRREAIVSLMAGKGATFPAFRAAVARAAPGCAQRPDAGSDPALVAAATSAFRLSAAALFLAEQAGLGQAALDDAWRAAPAAEKAPFYSLAEQVLDPGGRVSGPAPDAAILGRRAGVDGPGDERTQAFLRMYFASLALSERAEAQLAAPSR
jgi:hypothetical protein